MAHGKETPRQKMIGMMYLVLTALLALNVSKDVLEAFVIVDRGLTKTTKNFVEKNKVVYKEFEQAALENPAKAGKYKDMAMEIRKRSDALVSLMQDLKYKIIKKAEGENTKAITSDGEIDGDKIDAKENRDKPSEVMVGSDNTGQARGLKAAIKDYRTFLLSLVSPEATGIKASLNKELDTEDQPPKEKSEIQTWESYHFEQLPLIGVITILSSMQANVRNAEADILEYLYASISAKEFKFNQLEAVVIPKTDYVIKGDRFEAQLFIAAFDTTQPPRILIGTYEQKTNLDGTTDYNMKGSYDSIRTFENGKGIYNIPSGSTGEKKWGGLIVLKSPGGGPDIKKPFTSRYSVNEPTITVSPTKMNVFYRGVDNPVDCSAPPFPADKVAASISNGSIRSLGNGHYMVVPTKIGNAIVSLTATDADGKKKNMGTREFRVRDLPSPVAKVAGKKSGAIDKSILAVQSRITTELEGSEFDAKFTVVEFNVSVTVGGFSYEKPAKNELITQEQVNLIKQAGRGSRVTFDGIKVTGPEGSVRELPSVVLKLL